MSQAIAIEWAPFEKSENVTDEQLLAAAEEIQKTFLEKQAGYVKRELLKGDNNLWVDLLHWKDAECAQKAGQLAMESENCAGYFGLMTEAKNVPQGMAHFQQVKTWA